MAADSRFSSLLRIRQIVVLLVASWTSSTGAAEWLTEKALFYELRYTKDDAVEISAVKKLLESFHWKFIRDSKMTARQFESSEVAIELLPRSSQTIVVGTAQLAGGLPGPTAHDGSTLGSSGHAQDRHYFDKLLIHEVAPIYISLYADSHGVNFHAAFPDWFVQGIEEYFGVFDSTPYWSIDGMHCYYRRLAANPNAMDTEFGLTLLDPYNDGFLLLNFVHDEFGRDAIFSILADKEPSFGRRMKTVAKTSHDEFLKRIDQWKAKNFRLVRE